MFLGSNMNTYSTEERHFNEERLVVEVDNVHYIKSNVTTSKSESLRCQDSIWRLDFSWRLGSKGVCTEKK